MYSHLLALRYAIMRIVRMPYPFWYRSSGAEWVYRPQWAGERICWERVVVAICVRFRNNFWWKDFGEHTVLCLVRELMGTLPRMSVPVMNICP